MTAAVSGQFSAALVVEVPGQFTVGRFLLQKLKAGSVHLSIYSPPFGGLYHYSSSERDLSNSSDYAEFFDHYDFVPGLQAEKIVAAAKAAKTGEEEEEE